MQKPTRSYEVQSLTGESLKGEKLKSEKGLTEKRKSKEDPDRVHNESCEGPVYWSVHKGGTHICTYTAVAYLAVLVSSRRLWLKGKGKLFRDMNIRKCSKIMSHTDSGSFLSFSLDKNLDTICFLEVPPYGYF